MTEYFNLIALLFFATLALSLLTTRLSIFLSHKLDILDRPDPRKSHRAPIAYLGGLGMILAFLPGLLLFVYLHPASMLLTGNLIYAVVLGSLMIFCLGFIDDVRPIRAIVKLLLQIVVASTMWFLDVRIMQVSLGPDGTAILGNLISYCITVGWYVALMNSVNLVDGLDGLAGGICFLGALSLAAIGLVLGYTPEVLLGAVLATLVAGITLGYLRFNWHPARTFMGDSGSLLLGFLLATASLVGSTKTPTLLALSIPLVALGLPLFESVFSFLRRLLRGQHPFKPDRRHLHHRLLDAGLDQQRVVISLLFITALLGLNSVIMAQAGLKILFINVVFLVGGIVLLIENLKFVETQRLSRTDATPVPLSPPLKPKETPVAKEAEQPLL